MPEKMTSAMRRAEREKKLREDVRLAGSRIGAIVRQDAYALNSANAVLTSMRHRDAEAYLDDAADEAAELAVAGNAIRAGYVEWIAPRVAKRISAMPR